jgi:hypothetical protein
VVPLKASFDQLLQYECPMQSANYIIANLHIVLVQEMTDLRDGVQTNAVAASKKSPQLGPMDLGDPALWHMHTGKMTEPCRLMWCFLKT